MVIEGSWHGEEKKGGIYWTYHGCSWEVFIEWWLRARDTVIEKKGGIYWMVIEGAWHGVQGDKKKRWDLLNGDWGHDTVILTRACVSQVGTTVTTVEGAWVSGEMI